MPKNEWTKKDIDVHRVMPISYFRRYANKPNALPKPVLEAVYAAGLVYERRWFTNISIKAEIDATLSKV